MKKYVFIALAMLGFTITQAQKFDNLQLLMMQNKIDGAKNEIDKIMRDKKFQTNPEVYMWATRIYSNLYYADAKYDALGDSAQMFLEKYISLDPTQKIIKEVDPEIAVVQLIYAKSFNNAINNYNDKKFSSSVRYFKSSAKVIQTMIDSKLESKGGFAKGWVIDTSSNFYGLIAAEQIKDTATMLMFAERFFNNKIGGEDYLDVYRVVASMYMSQKDEANFNRIIGLGKELYPTNTIWEEMEFDYFNTTYSLTEKMAKYLADDAAGKLSALQYFQFGAAFVNIDKDEKDAMDSLTQAKFSLTAIDAFKKANKLDPSNHTAAYNAGLLSYNKFIVYDDRIATNRRRMQDINSNKPNEKDPKKKAAVEAQTKAQIDPLRKQNEEWEKPAMEFASESIEWLEKAFNGFKQKENRSRQDNSLLNKSVDFLAILYGYKRDKARGKDEKAFTLFEAKYKEFDGLHGKF